MKKELLLGSLCLLLLTGCSNDKLDKNLEEDSQSELPIMLEHLAESQNNERLEALVIDYYEIPKDYYEQTAYYYNYVDLNKDGQDEIFAVFVGPYMSGSGGSTAAIISQASDELEISQSFSLIHTPIIISDQLTNGYRNIITLRSGGGADAEYVELTYEDGQYKSVNDGTVMDSITSVTGDTIITNDLLEDRENGTLLTLE